jgi:hypothetical protein
MVDVGATFRLFIGTPVLFSFAGPPGGRYLPVFLVSVSRHFSFHSAMSDELLPDLLAAVEQQLVSPQTKYVAKTLERLVKAGVEEAEAKNQIALCLGEEMDAVLRKKRGFDENAYRAALDTLPLEPDDEAE